LQDYEKMVDVQNTNRMERMIDASGIDDVVKQLANAELSTPPASPGFVKRSKGAYMEYEERMLVMLKADQPGLKMSQYKVRVTRLPPVSLCSLLKRGVVTDTSISSGARLRPGTNAHGCPLTHLCVLPNAPL
jgi:hypothetical protein